MGHPLQNERHAPRGGMLPPGMLPADDPRNRSSAIGAWLLPQQQQQPMAWEQGLPPPMGTHDSLFLAEQEAWLQQQLQHPELVGEQIAPSEAALLHAGWAADACENSFRGSGAISPGLLAPWTPPPFDSLLSAGFRPGQLPAAADGMPPPGAGPAPPQQPATPPPPASNGIPQLRSPSAANAMEQPLSARRFNSLSDPAPPLQQLPSKPRTGPAAAPLQPKQEEKEQAKKEQQPLNPFQAAQWVNERFASPPPVAQPLQGALQVKCC